MANDGGNKLLRGDGQLPWLLVAAVIWFAVCLAVAPVKNNNPAPRWEYATFGGGSGPGKKPGEPTFCWAAPDGDYQDTFEGVYRHLGGMGKAHRGYVDILNAAGANGWRLVCQDQDKDFQGDLIFERPVAPGIDHQTFNGGRSP